MHPLSTQAVSGVCSVCHAPMFGHGMDELLCSACGAEWITAVQFEDRVPLSALGWHWSFPPIQVTHHNCPACARPGLLSFRVAGTLLERCPRCAGILFPDQTLDPTLAALERRLRRQQITTGLIIAGTPALATLTALLAGLC